MTKADEKKLDTFLHKCLRRILKVHWPMRVSNDAYGTKPKPTSGISLGARREKETRTAKGNTAKNTGKGTC